MARILLLLSRKQSDVLLKLKELLVKEGHDMALGDPEAVPEYDFDLCITDPPTLARLKTKIIELKRIESPVFLPFLLIASRQDVDTIDPSFLRTVDEIIFLPIAESELPTRVRGLLRARRATAELRESKLEMMQEMPVSILLLRRELIYYANSVFCELTGKSYAELKGTDFLHLLHPDDRAQAALLFDNVMAGKTSKPVLMLRLLTPKDLVWIELHLSAFSHDGIPGALAAVVEITDRIVREESLKAALEYADDIVQTVREPMVVLDPELRVVSANQSFYRTFRIAAPEACGKLLYELGNRQWDIPQLKSLLTRILVEQSSMEDFEMEHHFPSIGHRAMLLNARTIHSKSGGEPHLVLLAMEDVTERMELEKALREANQHLEEKLIELENVNEELSQFAYVASHDLRAPLRAIHNYADFLREDLEETLDVEQLEYLNGLRLAVRQGETVIDDILAFSRIGRLRSTLDKTDLGEMMREMKASLESAEEVEIDIADDWPVIEVDRTLLTQVLWNLAGNAIKFNRSDKKHLELGWRTCGDGQLELYVRDNGIGIDPAYHEQIFRIFQRLHTREEFEGTGIGLAIVRKAVLLMGGSVRVESQLAGGSTFFVTLPQARSGAR